MTIEKKLRDTREFIRCRQSELETIKCGVTVDKFSNIIDHTISNLDIIDSWLCEIQKEMER